jgi:hypothetical protein
MCDGVSGDAPFAPNAPVDINDQLPGPEFAAPPSWDVS